jgi:hypothetical protein
MPESSIRDTQIAFSKVKETAYNTPHTTAANFLGLLTSDVFFYLPKIEQIVKDDLLGHEFPTHACNDYWQHSEMSFTEDLETKIGGRFLAYALGGSINATAVAGAASVNDLEFAMLPASAGRQLPSFDVASVLGAADFLMAGVCVDKFRVEQKRSARATYKVDCVGSGKYVTPNGISGGLPSAPSVACMDGRDTVIKYTSGSVVDLSATYRVMDWFVEVNNNLKKGDKRLGDPTVDGAGHVRKLLRGEKRQVTTEITLAHDGLTEWTLMKNGDILTDLTYTVKGPIIGATTARNEIEFIIPKAQVSMVETGNEDGTATVKVSFVVLEDPVTKGGIKARVRTNEATPYI